MNPLFFIIYRQEFSDKDLGIYVHIGILSIVHSQLLDLRFVLFNDAVDMTHVHIQKFMPGITLHPKNTWHYNVL